MIFADREDAGRRLAEKLIEQKGKRPLVLAVPRGGVPIARIVAGRLAGDLDVILVHKVGFPGQPEFAIGSVSEDGDVIFSAGYERYGLSEHDIRAVADREVASLKEKRRTYTPHGRPIAPEGRTVIAIDDGIATGSTMLAAVRALDAKKAGRVIVATPVASAQAVRRLGAECAEVVALDIPKVFHSVGQFYRDFSQVSDDEVVRCLREFNFGARDEREQETHGHP